MMFSHCRSLVLFLSTLLHYHNPPDQLHLTWSSLLDTSHPACSSYPLRCLFLLFLLPTAKPGGPLAQQEEQGGALGILATNLRTSNRCVAYLCHTVYKILFDCNFNFDCVLCKFSYTVDLQCLCLLIFCSD